MTSLYKYFANKVGYLEGGNVSFVNAKKVSIKSGEIDLSKIQRQELVLKLKSFFLIMNKSLKAWKEEDIQSGHIFSGSTSSLFNKDIHDEEFLKYKPKLGDIDVLFPRDKVEQLRTYLNKSIDKNIAGFLVEAVNTNATTNVGQFHALLNFKGNYIQVDFEFANFDNSSPTEFAKFGHSSAWEDIKSGVKSKFHKILLSSITNVLDKEFHKNVVIVGKNGKAKKIDYPQALSRFALSIDKGLRKDRFEKAKDANGKPFKIDGKEAWIEVDAKDSKYDQNLPNILDLIFHHKLSKQDLDNTKTFSGLVRLINKYLPQEKKYIIDIYKIKTKGQDEKMVDSTIKLLKDKAI